MSDIYPGATGGDTSNLADKIRGADYTPLTTTPKQTITPLFAGVYIYAIVVDLQGDQDDCIMVDVYRQGFENSPTDTNWSIPVGTFSVVVGDHVILKMEEDGSYSIVSMVMIHLFKITSFEGLGKGVYYGIILRGPITKSFNPASDFDYTYYQQQTEPFLILDPTETDSRKHKVGDVVSARRDGQLTDKTGIASILGGSSGSIPLGTQQYQVYQMVEANTADWDFVRAAP